MNIAHIRQTVLALALVSLTGGVGIAQAPRDSDRSYDVQVPAQQQWVPTGIVVRQGQALRFEVTGEISLNQARTLRARSAGNTNTALDRAARMPAIPLGALIGQISSGGRMSAPFAIGDRASVAMPGDGELFLGINDSNFADDAGAFAVYIETPGDDRARNRGNRSQPYDFQIGGQQQWVPTGLVVRQGQVLQLESTGEVSLNRNGSVRTSPAGSTTARLDRSARLPSAPVGSLIGRIGAASARTNRAFAIGDRTSVTMPADGELFLGVNDSSFGDNAGAFTVSIAGPDEGRGRGRGRGNNRNSNNGTDFAGRDFQIPAQQQWVGTGITVRQGDVVRLHTTGEVTLNDNGSLRAQSNGTPNRQLDADSWMPNVPVGSLIGRVGPATTGFSQRNRPFAIGSQTSVTMPADGELFLSVNDSNFTDNNGFFSVRIDNQ